MIPNSEEPALSAREEPSSRVASSEIDSAEPPRRSAGAQRGFSLAELATVLMLISFLAGGVLLGNGIITQSRIKYIAGEFEGMKIAVLTYYDRYAAVPGDDPRAEGRWVGRSKNGNGDGRVSGSYQASPPTGDPLTTLTVGAADGESLNFWWHLRLAELIIAPPSPVTPVAQPLNHFAGVIGVEWAPLGFPRLAICSGNLPGEIALSVENILDDGDPRRGLIRAAKQSADNQPIGAADATVTAYATADSAAYILCRRLD
jgi:prepilin-type N-terminal cleavage/methylation domain-containing protein